MVSEKGRGLRFWAGLSQAPCRWRGAYPLRDGHFIGRYAAFKKVGVPIVAARPVTGGGLGRVAAVLVEAVLQLGNTVQQLIYELVGLLESQRVNRRCRVLFSHASKHAIRAGSCNRQMRIKRRSSHFSCQSALGERLHKNHHIK